MSRNDYLHIHRPILFIKTCHFTAAKTNQQSPSVSLHWLLFLIFVNLGLNYCKLTQFSELGVLELDEINIL